MAIQQHQGALAAETAQVQRIAGKVRAAIAGAAEGLRALEDRQLVQTRRE